MKAIRFVSREPSERIHTVSENNHAAELHDSSGTDAAAIQSPLLPRVLRDFAKNAKR